MKWLAVVIGLLTLSGIYNVYHEVEKPRPPMTVGSAVATILYAACILLLCMRVLGWV